MIGFRWLAPRSITTQITSIVAISVLLGVSLLVAILFLVMGYPANAGKGTLGQVAEITRIMRDTASKAEADTVLTAIQRTEPNVTRVAIQDLVPRAGKPHQSLITKIGLHEFAVRQGIELLTDLRDPNGPQSQIIARISDTDVLVFGFKVDARLWQLVLTPTALMAIIVIVSMLLLSLYAVRWVIAPLAAVADAASSFGRSPQEVEALDRRGPREIMQVTDALNEMRTRIRALLDDRTRMLAAISHDLRTPLTRLRLRTERVPDTTLRNAMLGDIMTVSRMMDETLEYLRDDGRLETESRIDLPSFLQTICSDFSDMGHAVSYEGPARLAYLCRPRSLLRAVTNIVDNAVKHGNSVTVTLAKSASDGIEIEVTDDGPGIPEPLREKVFEPFFKADTARSSSNKGFGLGLSIARDIIKRHGGGIEMKPREPRGLKVSMVMPAQAL